MKTIFRLAMLCTIAVLLVSFVPTGSAHAISTWTVTKTADTNDGACDADCSLREAVAAAGNGDTIQFAASLAGQTIALALGSLVPAQPITIDGTGLSPHVIISGSGANEVFIIGIPISVTFIHLDIINGSATATGMGGAISAFALGATINVSYVNFDTNNAPAVGGAVAITAGVGAVISDSTFHNNGNHVNMQGGAIYNNGTLTVDDSTFSSNAASVAALGGAIWNGGEATVRNSTFVSNNSAGLGAGIFNAGSLTLRHTSFSLNSGLGALLNNGQAWVYNTILADTVGGPDCSGAAFIGNAGNIIETMPPTGCSTPMISISDPGFLPLGNYGGPTQTLAILPGSPAYGSAVPPPTCLATDQRGKARPFPVGGGCDIGAYEYFNVAPTDISLSNSSVDENKASGTTVGTLSATDADVGDTHTYSLTCGTPGADDASFTTSGAQLQTAAMFDYETKSSYAICVRTTDSGALTYDKNFTISVNDLAEYVTTFKSVGTYDGWILESSETSSKGGSLNSGATTFNLGDDATKKQYRAVLSFNTVSLPEEAVITSVKLKFKKQGLAGVNPFSTLGNILADVKKGSFSGNTALQIGDFQAAAGKNAVLSFTNTPSGGWYSKNLASGNFTYINLAGVTQFRLRFTKDDNNNAVADYLKLYSGNATSTYRPQLTIAYYMPSSAAQPIQ